MDKRKTQLFQVPFLSLLVVFKKTSHTHQINQKKLKFNNLKTDSCYLKKYTFNGQSKTSFKKHDSQEYTFLHKMQQIKYYSVIRGFTTK